MVGRKPFVYQKRLFNGWCGPATLVMGLQSLGFAVTQEELAKVAPYDPDWGTDHESMLRGARYYSPDAYEILGKSLFQLRQLVKTNAVIVNFMDTEPGKEPSHGAGNGEDGHYVLLDRVTWSYAYVVDPNPVSPVDGGFRKVKREWLERHFWDIVRSGEVVERWALVIPTTTNFRS